MVALFSSLDSLRESIRRFAAFLPRGRDYVLRRQREASRSSIVPGYPYANKTEAARKERGLHPKLGAELLRCGVDDLFHSRLNFFISEGMIGGVESEGKCEALFSFT